MKIARDVPWSWYIFFGICFLVVTILVFVKC